MYVTSDERGVLAANPVRAGGVLFTVPLRLALVDVPGAAAAAHGPAAAALPWAARLALRLLSEAVAGPASPWAPWLRVLPAAVPSVYGGGPAAASLRRAGAALLPCPAAAAAVAAPPATVAAEWEAVQAAGLAPPGVDAGAWAWARGVVQSRTFGLPVAAAGGGAGGGGTGAGAAAAPPALARALVPLADMVNHAGEEAALLLAGPAADTATAGWELVPPPPASASPPAASPAGRGGGWSFVVTAASDLAVNAEVTFNYGAGRPNADFLASYGFVPPRNAHESVALWGGVGEAVAWWWAAGHAGGGDEPPPAVLATATAAADAAATPEDRAGAAHGEADVRAEAARLRLWAGGRADGRAVAALAAAAGGDDGDGAAAAAATAIAARAAQLLAASVVRGGAPLLPALAELGRAYSAEEAALSSDDECGGAAFCGEPASVWTALGRRYAALAPLLRTVPGLEAAAAVEGSGGAGGAGPAALAAPPGAGRETWRRARRAALTAAAYSTMVLWDAVAGALGRGGGGEAARAALAAAVERQGGTKL